MSFVALRVFRRNQIFETRRFALAGADASGHTPGAGAPSEGGLAEMTGASRTLFRKIWDAHVVRAYDDGTSLIHIDRHLVHDERTRLRRQRDHVLEGEGTLLAGTRICQKRADVGHHQEK